MTAQEKAKLKGEGFIPQREDGYFAMRVISHSGNFSARELQQLAQVAEQYGRGYLGLTTRMSVEIPFISAAHVPAVKAFMAEHGLRHGGTGKRVRPIVACKGTVCVHGQYDTQALSEQIGQRFLGAPMPGKTKLNFAGCPNNCAKVQVNDIGVIGRRYPALDVAACVGCGACERICRADAIAVQAGKARLEAHCVGCGHCIEACKFGALSERERGVEVYVGGVFGRALRMGASLGIFPLAALPDVIAALLHWYRENGEDGERLYKVIARLGIEGAQAAAQRAAFAEGTTR